jgi:hypothetical protein
MGEYIGLDWRDVEVRYLYEVAPWRIVCLPCCRLLVYESILTVRPI